MGQRVVGRAGPLSETQLVRLAWALGHSADRTPHNQDEIANNISGLPRLLLGVPAGRLTAAGRQAIETLYDRLDGSCVALTSRPADRLEIVRKLGEYLGRAAAKSRYLEGQRQIEAAATKLRGDLERVGGPHLKPFIASLYQGTVTYNAKDFIKTHPETAALEALSPEQRGTALLHCLRLVAFQTAFNDRRYRQYPDTGGFFANYAPDFFVDRDLAGPDRLPATMTEMAKLFDHLIAKKASFTEAELAEIAGFMTSESFQVKQCVRSLHVVKHIEQKLAADASMSFVREIETLRDKLGGNHGGDKFHRAALPRLAAAIETRKAAAAVETRKPAAPSPEPTPAPRPAGATPVFGKRAAGESASPLRTPEGAPAAGA